MTTVDYKDSGKRKQNPNIRALIGQEIVIESFEEKTGNGQKGEFVYALVKTQVGTFRTASGNLVDQLRGMKADLVAGNKVRVGLVEEGRMLRFTSP